jgi:hypothetical protein
MIAGADDPATLSGFFQPLQAVAPVAIATAVPGQHRTVVKLVVAKRIDGGFRQR